MIYHNFLLFKMNISSKIELCQKIEFAESLVLYSRQKNMTLIKKNFFFKKKKYVKKICADNSFKYINNQYYINKIKPILKLWFF